MEIESVEIDQDVIKILNWGNFHQMSETFYEEGKVYDYRKIIEDALKPSLSLLGSFDKTFRKRTYFKDRSLNLRN